MRTQLGGRDLLEVMAGERRSATTSTCRSNTSRTDVAAMRREAAARRSAGCCAHPGAVPGIALRSAFIVGFPGETEDDVRELCEFLEETEFAHVGVFTYSQEENTAAATLPDKLAERIKRTRRARVMEAQARVRAAARRRRSDGEWKCWSSAPRGATGSGRTREQAPEIDGVVRLLGDAAPGRSSPRRSRERKCTISTPM